MPRTKTRTVIAARTFDASSGLRLHGVVDNKHIIQLVIVEYSVIFYSWEHFHTLLAGEYTFAHLYNIMPYSMVTC